MDQAKYWSVTEEGISWLFLTISSDVSVNKQWRSSSGHTTMTILHTTVKLHQAPRCRSSIQYSTLCALTLSARFARRNGNCQKEIFYLFTCAIIVHATISITHTLRLSQEKNGAKISTEAIQCLRQPPFSPPSILTHNSLVEFIRCLKYLWIKSLLCYDLITQWYTRHINLYARFIILIERLSHTSHTVRSLRRSYPSTGLRQ